MNTIDQLEHLATLPATPDDDTSRIAQAAYTAGRHRRTVRTSVVAGTAGILGAAVLTAGYAALPHNTSVDVAASPTPTAQHTSPANPIDAYKHAVEAALPQGTTGKAGWAGEGLNYQANGLVWGSIVSVTTGAASPASLGNCASDPNSTLKCTATQVPAGALWVYTEKAHPQNPWRVTLVRPDGTWTGITLDPGPGTATTPVLAKLVQSEGLHLPASLLRTGTLPSMTTTAAPTPTPTGR